MTMTTGTSHASPAEKLAVLATNDPGMGLDAGRYLLGRLMGPASHLADERARLAALSWRNFTVKRLGATIGAEIRGVDITSDLSDDVIAEIRDALHAYKVIFFRDQPLTPAQHVAFAARFGELEVHPFIPANTVQPELVRFEKTVDAKGVENIWHHDVTWRECPSLGAVLHAVEVPECGGDTLFCDMYAAYDGLPDDVKSRIDGLSAEHTFLNSFRRNVPPDQIDAMIEKYPTVVHPLVATHPATGRKHLYANPVFSAKVVGMSDDESAELMSFLWEQSARPEYQVRWQWEKDSVAFWDNRACQHYASSDYWPDIRIMERASIVGTRPYRAR